MSALQDERFVQIKHQGTTLSVWNQWIDHHTITTSQNLRESSSWGLRRFFAESISSGFSWTDIKQLRGVHLWQNWVWNEWSVTYLRSTKNSMDIMIKTMKLSTFSDDRKSRTSGVLQEVSCAATMPVLESDQRYRSRWQLSSEHPQLLCVWKAESGPFDHL